MLSSKTIANSKFSKHF